MHACRIFINLSKSIIQDGKYYTGPASHCVISDQQYDESIRKCSNAIWQVFVNCRTKNRKLHAGTKFLYCEFTLIICYSNRFHNNLNCIFTGAPDIEKIHAYTAVYPVKTECKMFDFASELISLGYQQTRGYGYYEFKQSMNVMPHKKVVLMDEVSGSMSNTHCQQRISCLTRTKMSSLVMVHNGTSESYARGLVLWIQKGGSMCSFKRRDQTECLAQAPYSCTVSMHLHVCLK